MERTFKEAFAGFAKDTLDTLGRNPALAEFPLAVSDLSVATSDLSIFSFRDFSAKLIESKNELTN